MKLAKYSKAIAGAVGVVALVIANHVPIEVGMIEQMLVAILAVAGIVVSPKNQDSSD